MAYYGTNRHGNRYTSYTPGRVNTRHYTKKKGPSCRFYVRTNLCGPTCRKELQETLHDIVGYLKDKGCNPAFGSIADESGVLLIYYTPIFSNQEILLNELKENFPYEWVDRNTEVEAYADEEER